MAASMPRDQDTPPRRAAATTAEALPLATLSRWQRFIRSEWAVALLVLAVYGLFLGRFFSAGGDPRDFILIGSNFIDRAGPSALIKPDPGAHYTTVGYDGQFCYYIALDPVNAPAYIDVPAYRYTRILYPMTARLLALGQPALIPYTLILVNWLAIGGGTLALAAWLRRKGAGASAAGASPWFALAFGLYPGLFISLQRDLNEPLAYALVALAIYLFDFGGRGRLFWAGIAFALAALTRESAAFFALVYGLAVLLASEGSASWQMRMKAHWRQAALFLALALGPLALYKGFLLLWLKSAGLPADLSPELIPFRGIVSLWPWQTNQIAALIAIIFPALICAGMGLWALWQRAWGVEIWALLLNILLFVVLLAPPPYIEIFGAERITTGVVLAACCCLPCFDRLTGKKRWWFWSSSILWQALIPVLVILAS
jgi:hypothetical protein